MPSHTCTYKPRHPTPWLCSSQLEAQGGESAPVLPFFQHVEISAARLTIDYRPRRIDVAALRDGYDDEYDDIDGDHGDGDGDNDGGGDEGDDDMFKLMKLGSRMLIVLVKVEAAVPLRVEKLPWLPIGGEPDKLPC
eukprot:1150870-Pelagomonas_calceolata.AAC.1